MILKLKSQNDAVVRLKQWLDFVAPPAPAVDKKWYELIELEITPPPIDWSKYEASNFFGEDTEAKLKAYQASKGLTADGVFGAKTFAALRADVQRLHVQKGSFPNFGKISCPADQYQGGYNAFRFRADAAYWYMGFYNEMKEAGAIVTSSGSDRSVGAYVSAARSPTSMHYIATAFDLYVYSAMRDPNTDPYVVEGDGAYWRVWARSPLGETRTIANPITYKMRHGTKKPVTDRFIDLTAIAAKHNFKRIKPRASFFNGGNEMGAEWWHFQNEFVLFPLYSTFGEELLTLHSPTAIQGSDLREHTSKVFKIDWF